MRNAYREEVVARRYDSARNLPAETMSLWMETLKSFIPARAIHRVLDLGCGTGRFTQTLAETFGCVAVGVEPSTAMLEVASSKADPDVEWKEGSADNIPLEDQSVDLVFMSQVFHHLPNPQQALVEISRVLSPAGYLFLRNGTREHNHELEWLRFFPTAYHIEEQRTPYASEVAQTITAGNFVSISHQTLRQLFASSYADYFNKISCRGLSALISISDEEFQEGLEKFKNWVDQQAINTAVYEPIDVFIFQKRSIATS